MEHIGTNFETIIAWILFAVVIIGCSLFLLFQIDNADLVEQDRLEREYNKQQTKNGGVK